jgi:hypothetical protein
MLTFIAPQRSFKSGAFTAYGFYNQGSLATLLLLYLSETGFQRQV